MIDQALLDRVKKQAWFHKYPRGWPFLLFLIASITTAVSVMAIERADKQTRAIELDRNLTEISSALERRITENIALLRAASALFATQSTVSTSQFSEFARDLQGDGTLYGSLGMGWAPLVPVDDIPKLEIAAQDAGRPTFMVQPRPQPDQRYVVPAFYLEPRSAQNLRAIGFDMYSEPERRRAIERAIATRGPAATGLVKLAQDGLDPLSPADGENAPAAFLIYTPVTADRGQDRSVKGFVYIPFHAQSLLTSAGELYRSNGIDISIYDDHVAPETMLAEQLGADGDPGPTISRRIDVAGRIWIVQVADRRANALSALSRLTLFFGAMASLMVMAIGRLITKRAAEDRMVLEWLTSQASIRNSLTRELNHRVKNTLANVLSIAALTRRRSKDVDDFTESLSARIRALSATHDLLSQSDWGNAALGDIVRSELAPYMEGNESHVVMDGPTIKLAPNDAMSLGLAIHELATNAAKYGALSTIEGRIHIHWSLLSPDLAEIHWREEGGPAVLEPTKRGFGRDLIEKIVAHELKSEVDLRFEPGGVECRLKVPVRASREFVLRNERR